MLHCSTEFSFKSLHAFHSYHPDVYPFFQVFPGILQCLPLKEDFDENHPVYSCIIELFSDQHSLIRQYLPQLLAVFSQVLPSGTLQEGKLPRGGGGVRVRDYSCIIELFSDEHTLTRRCLLQLQRCFLKFFPRELCRKVNSQRVGDTPYNDQYGEATPERGTLIRLQVYKRVGNSLVEVYEREGKSLIVGCKKS